MVVVHHKRKSGWTSLKVTESEGGDLLNLLPCVNTTNGCCPVLGRWCLQRVGVFSPELNKKEIDSWLSKRSSTPATSRPYRVSFKEIHHDMRGAQNKHMCDCGATRNLKSNFSEKTDPPSYASNFVVVPPSRVACGFQLSGLRSAARILGAGDIRVARPDTTPLKSEDDQWRGELRGEQRDSVWA